MGFGVLVVGRYKNPRLGVEADQFRQVSLVDVQRDALAAPCIAAVAHMNADHRSRKMPALELFDRLENLRLWSDVREKEMPEDPPLDPWMPCAGPGQRNVCEAFQAVEVPQDEVVLRIVEPGYVHRVAGNGGI